MRLIATDYDGTLNDHGVGEEKIAAIREWRKAGNLFGVVSGRGPDFLPELVKTLGDAFDFLVLCNGSYAVDNRGNVLFATECTTVDAKEFAGDFLKWGAPIVYINYKDTCITVVAEKLEEMPEISGFYKVCTLYDDAKEVEPLAKKIEDKYGQHVKVLPNGRCLDIAPGGIDKAEGIRGICRIFGVDEKDVIAIGDELNDVAMLAAFPSYAMRHGNPKIRQFTEGIADSVTEMIMKELK